MAAVSISIVGVSYAFRPLFVGIGWGKSGTGTGKLGVKAGRGQGHEG